MVNETVVIVAVSVTIILVLLLLIVCCVWLYLCFGQRSENIHRKQIKSMNKSSRHQFARYYRGKLDEDGYSHSSDECDERKTKKKARWSGDSGSYLYNRLGTALSPIRMNPPIRRLFRSDSDIKRSIDEFVLDGSCPPYPLSSPDELNLDEELFEELVPPNASQLSLEEHVMEELRLSDGHTTVEFTNEDISINLDLLRTPLIEDQQTVLVDENHKSDELTKSKESLVELELPISSQTVVPLSAEIKQVDPLDGEINDNEYESNVPVNLRIAAVERRYLPTTRTRKSGRHENSDKVLQELQSQEPLSDNLSTSSDEDSSRNIVAVTEEKRLVTTPSILVEDVEKKTTTTPSISIEDVDGNRLGVLSASKPVTNHSVIKKTSSGHNVSPLAVSSYKANGKVTTIEHNDSSSGYNDESSDEDSDDDDMIQPLQPTVLETAQAKRVMSNPKRKTTPPADKMFSINTQYKKRQHQQISKGKPPKATPLTVIEEEEP